MSSASGERACAVCSARTASRCGLCEGVALCSDSCARQAASWHAGGDCAKQAAARDARSALFAAATAGDGDAAARALAVPGVVIGIGYLRTYYGVTLPSGQSLATFWFIIVIALAVRRLPYALRACTAGLQQVSPQLEEAAENLGATKARTVRRILLPLMVGGMLAGFVTAFATASVELSATMMLVQNTSDAPLAYGLYVYMQSPAGRGPGAALGMIAVAIVGLCTFLSHWLLERERDLQRCVREHPAVHAAPPRWFATAVVERCGDWRPGRQRSAGRGLDRGG
jgi:ABC-type molybdate transport system permease subunit